MRTRKKAIKPSAPRAFSSEGVEIATAVIPDPYEDGAVLRAAKNIRVHPLDHMKARGRITEIQAAAGDRFLQIYDRAEIGGARAIDYTRVKVDISYNHRGLDVGMAEATLELNRISKLLGRPSYLLMRTIIGERVPIHVLGAQMEGCHPSRATTLTLYQAVRDDLDKLAVHFGLGQRGSTRLMPPYTRNIAPFMGKMEVAMVGEKLALTG